MVKLTIDIVSITYYLFGVNSFDENIYYSIDYYNNCWVIVLYIRLLLFIVCEYEYVKCEGVSPVWPHLYYNGD